MNNMMIEIDRAITKNHTGKMSGMWSLSTSCLENPICTRRRACGSGICAKCYAVRELGRKKELREKVARNTELFTKHEIQPADVPYLNCSLFRFESFGELQNALQVKNYFTLCAANPHVTFALWTKNAYLIRRAMDQYDVGKPDNLIIIASMPYINQGTTSEVMEVYNALQANGYGFINKVFAVYTKKYAADNHIDINCGKKKCMECRRCYTLNDDTKVISERLK